LFLMIFRRPYRFFLIAGVLALMLCLLPMNAREAAHSAPEAGEPMAQGPLHSPAPEGAQGETPGMPAGADLSARTAGGCMLHETLFYAPCGHSVQRRTKLAAQLTGLTRTVFEAQMENILPGAAVTGFAENEVDVSRSLDIPCPLHWVLRGGEDGMLHILQNRTGEALSLVRKTDVPLERALAKERQALLEGRVFDDVQALEGYLESMSS